MRARQLAEIEGMRTVAVVFDKDEEPHSGLTSVARSLGLSAASLTGIGAFSSATLAYFDPQRMDYIDIPIEEQVEVLSMVGDVALSDGEAEVHAHVVVGRRDGSTAGGHLKEARVFPTLEVIITESPTHLRKRHDRETGLTLIDPESGGD